MSFDDHQQPDAFDQLDGPVHLPSMTAPERERVMGQLREWVPRLVRRFAIEPRVIPPCWEQHNGMVEALFALKDHERVSYAETAPPSAPAEWFRAFSEIEARLSSIGALTQCTFHEHRSGHLQDWASTNVPGANKGGIDDEKRPRPGA
jgi:hypothetical protein